MPFEVSVVGADTVLELGEVRLEEENLVLECRLKGASETDPRGSYT